MTCYVNQVIYLGNTSGNTGQIAGEQVFGPYGEQMTAIVVCEGANVNAHTLCMKSHTGIVIAVPQVFLAFFVL